MPIAKLVRIEAWSYSRYNDYEKCPLMAKLKHIDKRREPENDAIKGGNAAHESAGNFVLGKLKKLPEVLARFPKEFAALRKDKAKVEVEWAFTIDWKPTSWFGKDAWLRVKVDAYFLKNAQVKIIDHKTGKEREDHEHQRTLYALAAFLMFPNVDSVTVQHWYLDGGFERTSKYTRKKDFEVIRKDWIKKTKAMLSDTTFAPRPGNYCRWCFFRKENGGPCKY